MVHRHNKPPQPGGLNIEFAFLVHYIHLFLFGWDKGKMKNRPSRHKTVI